MFQQFPRRYKIGYNLEKTKPYISNALSRYNCLMFCHLVDGCYDKAVCGRCGQKDTDQTKNGEICAKAQIEVKNTLHIREYVKFIKKKIEIITVKHT